MWGAIIKIKDDHLAMAEFAIKSAHQESTPTNPFRLVYKILYKDPPASLSMGCTKSSIPAAIDFANQMHQSLVNAKGCLDAAR